MMMQTLSGGPNGGSRTFRKLAGALALIACFGLPGAYGGGSDDEGGPGAPTSGDDVTTLPVVVAGDSSGTVLIGRPLEIERLVRTARGLGTLRVIPRTNGEVAVAFLGDWNLRLRRSVLETSRVRVAFAAGATFEDGSARLVIGDGKPVAFMLDNPTLDMPLARLARAGERGIGWDFTVSSEVGPALRNVAVFGRNNVALIQRTSF